MKQLFLFLLMMISITLSSQKLNQIQKGTDRNQLPVTNGVSPVNGAPNQTLVYRDAIPYILDSLGVMDSILSEVPACCLDSIFLDSDSLYYVYEGDTLNIGLVVDTSYIPRIFTNETYADTSFITSPRKYDVYVHEFFSESFYYDGDSWEIFDYDNGNQNEGQLYLDDYIDDREATLRSNTPLSTPITFKASDNTMIIYPASGWVVYKVDTTVIATLYDLTLKQNTLVSGTNIKTINGNSLLGSGNLVISTVDSTNVSAGYGIDVTESPANTFTIKADTAEVATPYDLTLKQNTLVSGTNIKTINGNSLLGSGNLAISTVDSTTVLGGTGITAWESPANTWNIQNDDPDQTVTLTPTGIVSISGAYPNFTIGATEADGDPNNEKQTLSQSFTGSTEATYSLNLSGGSVKDTTGFMRLETMFSTAGSRTYRYKSNLGAILGITEDPLLGGNSNIEVLRTGNQLTWGLRKDNASNGQIYKYNGTAWALSSDVSGITSLNGLTASTQTFATGTSGTDFNISSATSTHTFNFPTASASNRGLLSSANWTTFNNKLDPSTTFGPDVTGTYNNLRGKYMQWNADLGFDANTFSSGKFTFRYVNAGVPSPGNVYGLLEVPLAGSTSNWQIGSRITDNLLYFRNNNATTGTWQQIFSTLNLPNGIKYGDDLSFDFNTNPANNTQAIRYAYANINSPDGNAFDGFDVRRNNTYGWQMAKNGTSPLYVRGRTTSTWGSWEIVPTLSTGTAITLYGLSSTNKLVPFTFGNGLLISGGALNLPAGVTTGNFLRWNGTAWASDVPIFSFGVSGSTTNISCNSTMNALIAGGTNMTATNSSGTVTVSTDVSYGYMNTTATTQSMTAGSSYKIALTNEINNGVVTASNANDRFTVSATGIYEIHYDLGFAYASGSSSNILELSVKKNGTGSPITGTTSQSFSTASATPVNTSRTVIASLNATDYIELFAQMASGTISVTYNFGNFSIKRID